ncbi:MAG: sugar ABC transporter permease [Micrococcales bacterium]|nr:sugar ABC transporter permease [Micrococcales bacterium]
MTKKAAGGRALKGALPHRRSAVSRAQGRMAIWLLLPAAAVVFGVVVYPIIRTGQMSLTNVNSAMQTEADWVGFSNYTKALTNPKFWASIGRTLYFTVVSTGIELLLGLALAGFLNAKIRGRWLLRTIVVIPWAIPTVVAGALWKGIFNAQYGSLNALLSQLGLIDDYQVWLGSPFLALNMVMLADIWKTVPVVAFMLLAGLTSIPDEVYEAARIDGAGAWRTLRSITLPLLVPSISIVMVYRIIEAFKVFDIIYAMTRGGPADGTKTIAYFTYTTAFSDQQYGVGSALSYLIVTAIAILSVLYLRALRRSEMSLL